MKRIFSAVLFLAIGVLVLSGCVTGRISGPKYQPPVAKLPPAVASFLDGKEVAISDDNIAKGVIADAVLEVNGVPVERKKAEVEVRADIRQESSSGYNHGYSPVPLVPSGPAYRIKVDIWVSENGAIRFHGTGADSYFSGGSMDRTLATERATHYALANLRGRGSR